MKKSRRLMLAALAGLLILTPVQSAYTPMTVQAGQISDASDSRLSDFDIAPGTLNPAFSPDVFQYTATVEADVTGVSVRAVPRSSSGTIASVEGARSLKPGVNTIKVTCSARDFSTSVYTITVTVGSAGGTQQPDTSGTDTQQPDAGEADAQQPDTSGTDTQQPDTSGTDTQQPDTSGTDTQQPDTSGTNTQQPDAGNTGETSSNTGSSNKSKKKKKKTKQALAALRGTIASDGTVTLNNAAYRLSNNFNYSSITQDIPSAFGQGSVEIGGTSYSTLHCEEGGMNLVYMENTDGNGSTGFYYYDEVNNEVERFKYDGTGDNFVVWISTARSELPDGFQQTVLKLPSGKEVAAYQNTSLDDMQDYYLVYGIYSGGGSSWYLYDNTQKTYLRYISSFAAQPQQPEEGEEEVARTVSLVKYNSLNEKYTQLKKNNVRIVSILAIALVLLIIVFTAILLRSREEAEAASDSKERSRIKKPQRQRRVKRQEEPVSKSSLAAGRDFEGRTAKNAKKVTKTFTKSSSQRGANQPVSGQQDNISSPEEIRAQTGREQNASLGRQSKTDSQSKEKQSYEQKIKEQPYGQNVKEPQSYERKRTEQSLQEQKLKEKRAYEQQLKEQQLYEQNLKEQQLYEQKLKEEQAYEQSLKERKAYEQSLKEQQAYEQSLKEQQAYEQSLKEQQAYKQRIEEQQAYEQGLRQQAQKLQEQQLYEQRLQEQQAYERKLEEQRAYEAQQAHSYSSAHQAQQKSLLKRDQSSGSTDSVQLAAEKMRQSMKYTRKNPMEQQEHDPMDDWEVEEPVSRRAQKTSRKKRSPAQEDMEIMDLNDL